MYFKNLQPYRLSTEWPVTAEGLHEQLATKPFRPCGSQDFESRGWIEPCEGIGLVHAVGDNWLVCMQTEQRLLPAAVVKDEAAKRAKETEDQQGFKLGRKAMKELREQITQELLPRAFTRSRKTFAWINVQAGWLVIDAASQNKAEDVLELLRHTLDAFPVTLLRTERSPVSAMAVWLAGDAPDGFTLDQDFALESIAEDRALATFKGHDLESAHVIEHLEAGRLPIKLAMTYEGRVSFTLTECGEIKRLDFLDVVRDQARADDHDDAMALFSAEFALMTGELLRLLAAIVEAMGGEIVRDPDLVDQANGGADLGRSTSDLRREVCSAFEKLAERVASDGSSMTISTGDGRVIVGAGNEHDPLYPDAKRIVLEQRRPSISLVQRHLHIGYNHAARLIEQMEADGLVSALKADGSREVIAA